MLVSVLYLEPPVPSALAHAVAVHAAELLDAPKPSASVDTTKRALRRVYDYAAAVEAIYSAHKRRLREAMDLLDASTEES